MDFLLIDIGKPKRLVIDDACNCFFRIETDLGSFTCTGDRLWRAYEVGIEWVHLHGREGGCAWIVSESMSLIGTLARLEYEVFFQKPLSAGQEMPLLSDDEACRYMVAHNFPVEFQSARRIFEESQWVDMYGANAERPSWLRSYVARLLNHRK